jgi:chromosome segregation ATPase
MENTDKLNKETPMDPDAAMAEIREAETTIAYLRTEKEMMMTYIDEWTHRFQLMQASRNRWRSCAMELADQLYKRLPNLPDLESFYGLLNDPMDGAGVTNETE